jgi:hypothetical protein
MFRKHHIGDIVFVAQLPSRTLTARHIIRAINGRTWTDETGMIHRLSAIL